MLQLKAVKESPTEDKDKMGVRMNRCEEWSPCVVNYKDVQTDLARIVKLSDEFERDIIMNREQYEFSGYAILCSDLSNKMKETYYLNENLTTEQRWKKSADSVDRAELTSDYIRADVDNKYFAIKNKMEECCVDVKYTYSDMFKVVAYMSEFLEKYEGFMKDDRNIEANIDSILNAYSVVERMNQEGLMEIPTDVQSDYQLSAEAMKIYDVSEHLS